MNTNAALAISNSAMGVTSLMQGFSQAEAYKTQGDIALSAAESNAKFAEMQADDAIARGEVASSRQLATTRKVAGAQRAALAAQGVYVDAGSALEAQVETGRIGSEDAMTIRTNAFREALGYKVQGNNYKASGKLAKMSGDNDSRNSILTGGLNAARSFGEASSKFADYQKDVNSQKESGAKKSESKPSLPQYSKPAAKGK